MMDDDADRPSAAQLAKLRAMEERFKAKAEEAKLDSKATEVVPAAVPPVTLKDVAAVHERMLERDQLPDFPVHVALQPRACDCLKVRVLVMLGEHVLVETTSVDVVQAALMAVARGAR